jgi:hypothetical protein
VSYDTTAPTFAAGEVVTAAKLNALADGIQAAWETWTPTWTGATSNPTLGNGTLTGRRHRIGSIVHFTVRISMGSTTTYGVGGWSVSMPFTAASLVNNQFVASGNAFDLSGNLNYPIHAMHFGGVLFLARNDGNLVGAASPFTWADGDVLSLSGTYEGA